MRISLLAVLGHCTYLLRIKETYNLSQKALDDTVQLTGTRQHEGQEDCSVSSLILFSPRF